MSTSCGLCQGAPAPIPAPGKWKADAKLSLLPTLFDALPAPKATGRPSANASVMWRFFTTSVYKSGDLPVLATREALQNSYDAIRA
ncbi:MAG TPA: hypothetical protein PLA94_32055, partial [Myxococcota bacterium]|nr:hypothetical protein [Myxococcota bacterium]